MKITKMLKLAGVPIFAMAFSVGCATTEEPEPAKPVEQEPVAQTPAEEPTVTPGPASSDSYEVVKGDNLWDISAKPSVYNNPYEWPLIYKNNSSKIKDADLIYPGQVLDINTNPSSAEVSAAVNHAKTRGEWSLGPVEDTDKAYLAQ